MTALLHLLVRQQNQSDPVLLPIPVPIPIPVPPQAHSGPRHANTVIAFIIGLSIIILASVLNAAGLNLTKLDHVFSSHHLALTPKSSSLRHVCRSEPKLSQRARGRETCYDHYGF